MADESPIAGVVERRETLAETHQRVEDMLNDLVPPAAPTRADPAATPRVILGPGIGSFAQSLPRRHHSRTVVRTRPLLIGLSIWAIGFAVAFALSWKTNANWNRGVFAKVSYGLGSGLHSWSYLVLWLMYVWGRHNPAVFVAKLADSAASVS